MPLYFSVAVMKQSNSTPPPPELAHRDRTGLWTLCPPHVAYCWISTVHLHMESLTYLPYIELLQRVFVCVGAGTSTLILQLSPSNVKLLLTRVQAVFSAAVGPTLECNTCDFWSGFKGLKINRRSDFNSVSLCKKSLLSHQISFWVFF